MPGFDGTGPRGQGPLTGGGFGYCAPGRGPRGFGRGFGRGMGRGFGRGYGRGFGPGWRRMAYFENLAYDDEQTLLEEDIKFLENEIQYLQKIKSQLEEQRKQSEK